MRPNYLCVALLVFLLPGALNAAQRTFVSAESGSDSNPCSRALPCRNLAAALSQTDWAGEVVALDSGGYGPLSISQSVEIVAPIGVHAGITVFSGTGISIDSSEATVILRGLHLNRQGSGDFGIRATSVGVLHIESCVVNGFHTNGIGVNISPAASAKVFIKDCTVRNSVGIGIFIGGVTGSLVTASIDQTRVENSGNAGIRAGSNSRVTVRESVTAGNLHGFSAAGFSGPAELEIESCVTVDNTNGISAGISGGNQSEVDVSNTTIAFNATGLNIVPTGSIHSRGNNTLRRNTTNGSFTGVFAPQ